MMIKKEWFSRFGFILLMAILYFTLNILAAPVIYSSTPPIWISEKYIRAITIDNTANSNTLSNYPILLTIDTTSLVSAGKMRSDCGDVRFLDSDVATQLSYWVETGTCNTASTRIWVKVPSIPGGAKKTIYMVYGNQSLASQSDGSKVFIFFQDFMSPPPSYVTIGGSWTLNTEYPGYMCGGTASTDNWLYWNLTSILGYSLGRNVAIGVKFQMGSKYSGFGSFYGSAGGGVNSIYGYYVEYLTGTSYIYKRSGSSYTATSMGFGLTTGTWYRAEIQFTSSSVIIVTEGKSTFTYSDTTYTTVYLGLRQYDKYCFDWVYIRPYSSPEPSVTIGNEYNIVKVAGGNYAVLSCNYPAWLQFVYNVSTGVIPRCQLGQWFYTSKGITLDYNNGTVFTLSTPGYVVLPNTTQGYWNYQLKNGKAIITPVHPGDRIQWYSGSLDINVTFTLRQYGTNYRVIEIRDILGNIIGRRWLDMNSQAFMALPWGANVFLYLVDVDKGQSKLYGSFTVSSTSYVFTIMPPPPPSVYPGNLTAVFESNSSTLHVWGSCRSPPCTLVVKKWNTTGLFSVYTLTIITSSFDVKIVMSDPYTIVELQDSNGNLLARGFTGSTTIINATIASEFNTLLVTIAEHTMPNGDTRWLVVLIAVLTFLVLSTVGEILVGVVAMGMLLTLLGWVIGWTPIWGGGLIILIFTAVLYHITRRW